MLKAAVPVIVALATACAGSGSSVTGELTDPRAAEYRIGPGDQLQIYVWNHPDVSVTVPVRPDGRITTPLVEDMRATGKTPTELARDMEDVLSEFIRSPTVNVIVSETGGNNFNAQIRVVGEAENPSSIPFRTGMTVLDVVIEVGGLAEFAAGNRARLVRRSGSETREIEVRLDDIINRADLRTNVQVAPGDILVIPPSRF